MLLGSDPPGDCCRQLLKLSGRSFGRGCSTVGAVMVTSGLVGGGVVGVWPESGTCAPAAVAADSNKTDRYQQHRRGMTFTGNSSHAAVDGCSRSYHSRSGTQAS